MLIFFNFSVQFSHLQSCLTLQFHGLQYTSLPCPITNSWSLLKLMSIKLARPSNHLILCHPLLLLPSIFLSTKIISNESVLLIWWSKYWSFSFSIIVAFLPRSKSFNFMAVVTIYSDFGVQENKVCYCFHCFSTYLP